MERERKSTVNTRQKRELRRKGLAGKRRRNMYEGKGKEVHGRRIK